MFIPMLLLSLLLHPPALVAWPETPPPLSSLARFPDAETCDRQLAFLAARRAYLEGLRGFYRGPTYHDWFVDAIADVEERSEPWAALKRAHDATTISVVLTGERGVLHTVERPNPDPTRVRLHLAELRRLLGERAYEAAALPGLMDRRFMRPAD